MSNARNLANLLGTSSTVPASGMPNGSWIMIHSQALGDAADQVSFNSTYITSTYDDYVMIGKGCTPTTDSDEANIRLSIDNGSNFLACDHARSYLQLTSSAAQGAERGRDTEHIQIATDLGNDANMGGTFTAWFYGLNSTSYSKWMNFTYTGKHANEEYTWRGGANIETTSAINWMSFKYTNGNVAAGSRVALYGIKGSNF